MTNNLAQVESPSSNSLVSKVMLAVNDHIRSGALQPGDNLPAEAVFALQIGVSRAVVREAFRSLGTLGIIEVGNGRRARVGSIQSDVLGLILDHAVQTDQVSIQQIYDVRRTIEMRTVGLAALRRTAKEAETILQLAAAMRRDFADHEAVMGNDIAFHEMIGQASRNPLFGLIVRSFSTITRQTWSIGWVSRASDGERIESIDCHERIAAAIDARDPKGAEAAMADHFDNSVKALLKAGVI
jgi:GntR family transcriptional regulator, transcriptional repressor for pyruvate dehydrogenase complex